MVSNLHRPRQRCCLQIALEFSRVSKRVNLAMSVIIYKLVLQIPIQKNHRRLSMVASGSGRGSCSRCNRPAPSSSNSCRRRYAPPTSAFARRRHRPAYRPRGQRTAYGDAVTTRCRPRRQMAPPAVILTGS